MTAAHPARRTLPLLALLLFTALAYAALWPAAYSWDDEALVRDNQVTGSLTSVAEFFKLDLWATTRLPTLQSGYYRPLLLLSLAVDRALFGLNASFAHLHSLLWHLGAVAALYVLLARLLDDRRALLGATLFALHPVQSEVLALVAARNDSMAAAMALSALALLCDRERPRWGAQLGAGALAFLALLSKESAVLLPFMLLALDLGRWRRPGAWSRYVALGLPLVAYAGLRAWAGIGGALVPDEGNWALVARRSLDVAAVYGSLLVWPWPLSPARHIHYLPPLSSSLLGLVLAAGLVVAALRSGRERGLVIAGLLWALLTWAPSLAATLDKGLLGERYLYFPVAGVALALAAALPSVPRWAPLLIAVPGALVLQIRLPQWRDSQTVWQAANDVAPTPFTHAGLAWYLHHNGHIAESLPHFVAALEGDPPYLDVCEMIVSAHLEAKQIQEAARVGLWAMRERGCPLNGELPNHTAMALAGVGRWDEAVQIARARPGGAAGTGIIVIAAAYARKGDLRPIAALADRLPTPPTLGERVVKLLRLSGDPEAAARVAAALAAPPAPAVDSAPSPEPR